MRFIKVSTFAILATLCLRTANAQTLYTCGEGPVQGVRMITERVAGPLVVLTIDPLGEPQQLVERAPDEPRQAVLVTVQLFDVAYTGEAFAADPGNFDVTQLQEDQVVAICVNRDQMTLTRGEGSEFRARIIRTDRVGRPTATQ